MEINLKGKSALVTGGSSGIGESCVRILRECGAEVAFTFHKSGDNAATIAGETGATRIRCDVTNEVECREAVEQTVAALGAIDILVNNAGIYVDSVVGDAEYLAAWRAVLETNLYSSAYFTHYAVPFLKSKGGKIINISSIYSVGGTSYGSAYHSSKAGMDALTRSLAVELAPFNIQVNSVGPGPVKTPIWEGTSAEYISNVTQCVPARRFGEVHEIATAVAFFSSSLSDYITGQTIFIDGGTLVNIWGM
jgi:NAD(P)-dependent dehydrogenase (short-subunit alcohol dehydrogenase family)